MAPRVKVYFDGGCRPNPGAMETAVVARGREHVRLDQGQGDSMDAEWLALLHGLDIAQALALADFVLLGDCAAVIAQANGRAKCPPAYRHHLAAYHTLATPLAPPPVRYIKRAQNLAGIALARRHPR